MLYKPNFCCQCGEKIENIDWNLLTSRRFCQLCATEFTVQEWIPRIGLGLGLIFGIFFIGSFFQSSDDSKVSSPGKILNNSRQIGNLSERKKEKQTAAIENDHSQNENLIATPSVQTQTNNQNTASNKVLEDKKQVELLKTQQNGKKEPVYFCGAETKKGKPCTRRVKGTGRCWQHQGKDAMLPEKQLLAGE